MMTLKQKFKKGDKVWFISKFRNRVTGVYDREDTIPGAYGEIKGHIVISDNAFGRSSPKAVNCFVSGKLNREVA
jgi:hypothetical protein